MTSLQAKDLTKEPPRSPYEQIDGVAIIARTIDKCRSKIAGTIGEFHFDCPVDNMLFGFFGIKADDFKAQVEAGKTDEEIAAWVKATAATPKTDEEMKAWAESHHHDFSYATDPQKKDWFAGECARLGLDSAKTTLFDMLVEDDKTIGK
jgi:hypothetical protein